MSVHRAGVRCQHDDKDTQITQSLCLSPAPPAQREQMFSQTLPCATYNTLKTVLFLVFLTLPRQKINCDLVSLVIFK